ncbi:hypothetical protein L1987_70901 [Smallanthus sonchifolius]|uniref:Uncharacterized protein n=1 Tax=Smallanthus sonchifolius TaxID=185202 RepID=A0ACB9AQ34_9ASTR|nr:hypothetical protein L1987_70901 [Smallanthus sonchifolius]
MVIYTAASLPDHRRYPTERSISCCCLAVVMKANNNGRCCPNFASMLLIWEKFDLRSELFKTASCIGIIFFALHRCYCVTTAITDETGSATATLFDEAVISLLNKECKDVVKEGYED